MPLTRGQITSISLEELSEYDRTPAYVYVTIKDMEGYIITIRYSFESDFSAANFEESIELGLNVVCSTKAIDREKNDTVDASGALRVVSDDRVFDDIFREFVDDGHEPSFNEGEAALMIGFCDELETSIINKFEPTREQTETIHNEMDGLRRDVRSAKKSNWRRQFFGALMRISIDLGLGFTLSEAMINLIRDVLRKLVKKYYVDRGKPKTLS